MQQADQYKYFAFISYNSKDLAWGKRLQNKLEHYKLPTTLCSEHGWERYPMKPVFFAPTDIQPGGLTQELQERLVASRHLIVICSPHSAQSEWVGKEIEFFHQLGRTSEIHFFIVDGKPHSGNPDTECFNPVVEKLGMPEILGANIHEKVHHLLWLNRERAYVQLISKLLGVEFDAIWQRHKRRLIRSTIAWIVGVLIVLAALIGVWVWNQPVDVHLSLSEASVHNSNLPPLRDAVVKLELPNTTDSVIIHSIDGEAVFKNIPRKFLNKQVHVTVSCRDFITTDTIVTLTKDLTLNIARDPAVYGNVYFHTWNPNTETVAANTTFCIGGFEVTTDEEGGASLFIPLEKQAQWYSVAAPLKIERDTFFMPCGQSAYIIFY